MFLLLVTIYLQRISTERLKTYRERQNYVSDRGSGMNRLCHSISFHDAKKFQRYHDKKIYNIVRETTK